MDETDHSLTPRIHGFGSEQENQSNQRSTHTTPRQCWVCVPPVIALKTSGPLVASEVRALAGRSATAAKEIKTLINSSIEEVQGGSHVVESAGSIIKSVSASATAVRGQMAEVAQSAHAQSAGILEVGTVIHQLDQTTQQNAALVEETTSAANLLADQAGRLNEVVSFFKFI